MAGARTLTTLGDRARRGGRIAYLFLLMECDRPTAPAARYCLGHVHRVEIGRGGARSATIESQDSLRTLSVRVSDDRMSSLHCRIERAFGKWIFVDSGSKNGSYLRGERTKQAELADGDVLELGHTLFLFRTALSRVEGPALLDASELAPAAPAFATLVPDLQLAIERLLPVIETRVPILVSGESGTGKELVARAIHRASGRRGAMVSVSCGAIPETLAEPELLGRTDGGTLLVDELGDLSRAAQPVLLRVLQEPVDVRVVTVTQHDPEQLVQNGRLRADLLARLAGFRFELPPLRDRREDLGLIVASLLHRILGPAAERASFSVSAARALLGTRWSGNVRELERSLETACALAGGGCIDEHHLSERRPDPFEALLRDVVRSPEIPPRAPGMLVGERYRLERHLGEGGMGSVWAATHVVTLRSVALKFMRGTPERRDELAARFRREARAAAAIDHPGVVPVHDVFEVDSGELVMVMELLDGESLADKLSRDGALSLAETAAILVPVLETVRAAHAAGVIHRDLKPDNIFLSHGQGGGPRPRVLDFGLARVPAPPPGPEAGREIETSIGSVLGTPSYMAPEQAAGHKVDHRADIFVLGAVLYECLSGRRAVDARAVNEAVEVMFGSGIAPLADIAPHIPREIAAMVGRMLETDPARRLSNLDDAIAVLMSYSSA